MKRTSLNGTYDLFFYDSDEYTANVPAELQSKYVKKMNACVPGNAELDLSKAGLLPEDLFYADHILKTQEFELYDFWYERDFEINEEQLNRECLLEFHGVDLIADYFINGVLIGQSRNMYITHTFPINAYVRSGKNRLSVKLSSAVKYASEKEYPPSISTLEVNYESAWLRKAPHSFGWDIMPRALSCGLWKDVFLVEKEEVEIEQVYLSTLQVGEDLRSAKILFHYNTKLPTSLFGKARLTLSANCGGNTFEYQTMLRFHSGATQIFVPNAKLWWPADYGNANLYDIRVCVQSVQGEVLAEKNLRFGIRQAEFDYSETGGEQGYFHLTVNHTPIFIKGTNWVAADVFHSRDKARLPKMLPEIREVGCNLVRCWGGNVYEDDVFFDYCDEAGVMVWQDFAMACSSYPYTEEFFKMIAEEVKQVVLRLRNHTSLITYCGDNECDLFLCDKSMVPAENRITREVIPQTLAMWDGVRNYVPSSPYVSEKTFRSGRLDALPENHLWGARDNFKSSYYTQETVNMIGEIGYHGCVAVSSIKRFISNENLDKKDSQEWAVHATETVSHGVCDGNGRRIELMSNQIREFFGAIPSNLEDYALASQISQAEAVKFFIEFTRQKKWKRTGIIWWNLIDGWPQFSDAVIDYYFNKKLAYHYIKRSQEPIAIIMREPYEWFSEVLVDNIGCCDASGTFEVVDADEEKVVLCGEFFAKANTTACVGKIPVSNGDQKLFLLKLSTNGKQVVNHYLHGNPPFALDKYKEYLQVIVSLDNDFQAQNIAK